MLQGILTSSLLQTAFGTVNDRHLCEACRSGRQRFTENDKKYNGQYSNLVPGFSSEQVDVPLDVLVIGNAHAGTVAGDFRDQWSLADEIQRMDSYYRELPDKSYHQQQVRLLLEKLNMMNKTWVFTDLVKCFVWQHGTDGHENMTLATDHCRKYLRIQIAACQPRTVISLGGTVTHELGTKEPKHGVPQNVNYGGHDLRVVHSLFPSGRTADDWVSAGGWALVLKQLGD